MSFTFLQCEDVNKYLCSQRHTDIWTDKPFHLIASWRTQDTRSNSTWGQVKATVHSVIPLTVSEITILLSLPHFLLHGWHLSFPLISPFTVIASLDRLSAFQMYIYTNIHIHIQFSHSVVSNSLRPPGLQHARLPCPSPIPRVYANSCSSSRWCHPTISSSVVPFSSHLWSFLASGCFQMSQFSTSNGQSIEAEALASVLPMNTQD